MKTLYYKLIYFSFFLCPIFLSSCSLVERISGAHIDEEQYTKAREAKMLELRFNSATKLSNKMGQGLQTNNYDVTLYLKEELLRQIIKQYESMPGWLDESTSYIVRKVELKLYNGSAIASLDLNAYNKTYDVNLDLILDCILTVDIEKNELIARIEPFNVSPQVSAGGILSSTENIIKNLIKKNLAELDKNFPPLKIPVDFTNTMKIDKSVIKVKDKINLTVNLPERNVNYILSLKDLSIFEGYVFVALNIDKVEVK